MYVIGFEARLNGAGKETHWMHYAANPAESQLCANWARVKEFVPTKEDLEAPASNDHSTVKKLRWDRFVKPAYDAWMAGNALPEGGTPLSAWLELTRAQIEALKKAGIASVEQIAEMNETVMGLVPLPNKHALRTAAAKFLEMKDAQAANAELEALRREVEALKKPKRGRPRKDAEPETEGEAA